MKELLQESKTSIPKFLEVALTKTKHLKKFKLFGFKKLTDTDEQIIKFLTPADVSVVKQKQNQHMHIDNFPFAVVSPSGDQSVNYLTVNEKGEVYFFDEDTIYGKKHGLHGSSFKSFVHKIPINTILYYHTYF